MRFTPLLAALILFFGLAWWLGGYHFVHAPTADQLYGCSVKDQDPATDECK